MSDLDPHQVLAGQQGISSPVSLLVGLLAGLFSHLSSPEILRYSRQVLEKEDQEEELNECIRTLRELVSQWSQEEDTMDPTSPEEDMGRGNKSLATQMGCG